MNTLRILPSACVAGFFFDEGMRFLSIMVIMLFYLFNLNVLYTETGGLL